MYKDQPIRLSPKRIQDRILERQKRRKAYGRDLAVLHDPGEFLYSNGGLDFYENCIMTPDSKLKMG